MQSLNQQNSNIESIYRLGLDLGTSSIGWAILKFNIINEETIYDNVIAMGSRIFSDGRTSSKSGGLGDSLAAARRMARQARRQIDRKVGRRMGLFYELQKIGLMPKNQTEANELKDLNPYELRSKGICDELTPYELGRAIFHLQQRRGFKSSRKDLQKETNEKDEEKGAVKGTIKRLADEIKERNFQTVGQLLYSKYKNKQTTLCKKILKKNKDGKDSTGVESYQNYFDRSMIMHEFNLLWQEQSKNKEVFANILTDENKELIRRTIFFQRPLKDQAIGKCTYIHSEPRAALCLPSTELYRIWADIGNLVLKPSVHNAYADDKMLSLDEKQMLVNALLEQESMAFTKALEIICKDKKQAKEWKCNLDTSKSDKLNGAKTYSQLIKILGLEQCNKLGLEKLDQITKLIFQDKLALSQQQQSYIKSHRLDNDEIEQVFSQALKQQFDFSDDIINALIHIKLNDDYASISTKAMMQMLQYMNGSKEFSYTEKNKETEEIKQGFGASQYWAKVNCDFKDNQYRDEALAKLPYYGEVVSQYCIPQKHLFEYLELNKDKLHANTKQEIEVGKITNPSVHITLNELRKIVNLLLEKYGKILNNHQFDNIHIELSRDLCLGQKSVDDIIRKQNKNETINQKYKDELLKLGIMPNKESMLKLSLFKYLEAVGIKQCIYTGNPLPASSQELFNNSADWEIDHILPYSRSFDDSRMNKILIHRIANQAKGERTPWEYVSQYFTPTEQQEFRKFILSKFPDEEKGGKIIKRGRHWVFLEEGTEYLKNNPNAKKHERLMNDTRYMTRVARMYLQALYNKYDDSIERKEQRNNKVVAIPSGKITAHMRREWHLDNLLWTDEQKEVRKDIKIQLQNYKDSYDNNQLSDELLRKYDMLSDLKNCCIDRKTYEYFNELMDKSISEGLSEKDVAEANDKFNKAKAKLKNRNDHRHHALDAVVIALADISMVQNAGKTSKQNEYLNKNEKEKIIQKDAPPTLREHLKQRIAKINVSHKPDHATAGVMHKETAMNIINTYGDKCSVKANKEIIKNITQKSLLGIKDKTGRIYKYYATESNYCYEIYINEKGKIDGDIISTYTTNQKAYQQYMQDKELFNSKTFNNGNPHEGKKLLMRLIMGDMLQIEDSGIKRLVYIQKMTEGQIVFNEHFEANCNARYLAGLQGTSFIAKGKSPSKFKEWNAQKVVVTPIGQVKPLKKIKY